MNYTDPIDIYTEQQSEPRSKSSSDELRLKMGNQLFESLWISSWSYHECFDDVKEIDKLSQVCQESFDELKRCYRECQEWLKGILLESVIYQENAAERTIIDSDSRLFANEFLWIFRCPNPDDSTGDQYRASHACEVISEHVSRLFDEHFQFPPLGELAYQWFAYERIKDKPARQIFQEARDAFRRMANSMADAIVTSLENASADNIYGTLEFDNNLGQITSTSYRIEEQLRKPRGFSSDERAPYKRQFGVLRTTIKNQHTTDVVAPAFYDFDATLKNPYVQLLPRIRKALEGAPFLFRKHLFSVLGTQTKEVVASQVVDVAEVTERSSEKSHLESFVKTPMPESNHLRVRHRDPSLVLCGRFVILGWKEDSMKQLRRFYHDYHSILDGQRKHLDDASQALGVCYAGLATALGLMVLIRLQLYFIGGWMAAISFVLPEALTTAVVIWYSLAIALRNWKESRDKAETVLSDGLAKLAKHYRGFRPKDFFNYMSECGRNERRV